MMIVATPVRVVLAALGAGGTASRSPRCDNDKDIDPPAELVDIEPKRDCAAAPGASGWAATPSSCGSRCDR